MKKFMSFLVLMFTVFVIGGGLTACSSNTKSANGFTFSYESNSAQKQTVSEQDYIVIALDVKNDNKENNTLTAEKFSLVQEGETVSLEVFFGNNIIDQMTEETLEANDSEKVNIMIKVASEIQGEMKLKYDQTELFEIRI